MSTSERPVKEIKLGRIRASIWANESPNQRVWHSVVVSRIYRDGETWKESNSFGRDDLPVISKAAELAYAWIWSQTKAEAPSHG